MQGRTTGAGATRHDIFISAQILDEHNRIEIIRNEVQKNRILFYFPDGFAKIPVIEECRALEDIENFDLIFDITMQMLVEKRVEILLKDDKGVTKSVCKFVVTNRYMDLHGVDFIDTYPCVVAWLTEFMQEYLLKKFPLPPEDWSKAEEAEKAQQSKKNM